jgi:hypothetical protein
VPRGLAVPQAEPQINASEPALEKGAARQEAKAVIKPILGLLALLSLAYVAGHPKVKEWEGKLGISQVITAGFPFVVLGMVARLPRVGILSDSVLVQISPLLRIGLGWIGFMAGFRFDTRLFNGLPSGTARVVAIATSVPFAFVLGVSGLVLLLFTGGATSVRDPVFIRDALILGTAGAMTAETSIQLFKTGESAGMLSRIIRLEELAGVLGLAIVAAYFRPSMDVTWQLPGTAWLLLTVGLGATVGIVVYAILQRVSEGPEFIVLTLGSISFAAGIAGYLRLSSIAVAFIAGIFLANFPGAYKARLDATLRRLERPVYFLSLVVIGALWQMGDWKGWALVPMFMAARLLGKWVGTNIALRGNNLGFGIDERHALAIAPMGPLAVAIVVNAQLLYPGGTISLIVSAVIGGAILTEIVVQLVSRRFTKAPPRERTADSLPPSLGPPPPLAGR